MVVGCANIKMPPICKCFFYVQTSTEMLFSHTKLVHEDYIDF